jgi:GAF domain-containing protein
VHPLVRENLAIRDLDVIAYLGVPLITAAGHTLGTLCVIDHKPRAWTADQIETITVLAASVVSEIELAISRSAP